MTTGRRSHLLLGAAALALASLLSACGGNLALSLKAGEYAAKEKPSAEMVVVRLREVEQALVLTDKLLYDTPVDPGAPWLGKLNELNQLMAEGYVTAACLEPAYSRTSERQVLPLKIYTVHLGAVLPTEAEAAEMRKREGVHANFMEAMASLGGPEAVRILEVNEVVTAAIQEANALDEGIKLAELELASTTTSAARRTELEGSLKAMNTRRTLLLKDMPFYKNALTRALSGLSSVRVTSTDQVALVRTLMAIATTAVRMDNEAITTALVLGIHAPQAIPGLPDELQSISSRFAADGFATLKAEHPDQLANLDPNQLARDLKVNVEVDRSTLKPRLQIEGGPDLEALKIDRQDALRAMTEAAFAFIKDVQTAPDRVPGITNLLGEQLQLLLSMGSTLASMSGVAFESSNPFVFDATRQALCIPR